MSAPAEGVLAELAPTGKLRAAINVGNPATARVAADGTLSGPSVELARRIADTLGLEIEFISFPSAGQVTAAEEAGDVWDVAFLAIDPGRMRRLHFSRPYLSIQATYAVPAASPVSQVSEIDRSGVRIASSKGAAYDLHLQRTLAKATLVPFDDPSASFAAFHSGGFDAVAGVRQALERNFTNVAEVRILPGHFMAIDHAGAVPIARARAAKLIDDLVGNIR